MSDMKCIVCGKDLVEIELGECWFLVCCNSKCKCKWVASDAVWEYIDRTRKALDVAVDALKLMYQGNGDPQDIMRYIDNRWTPVRRLCKQTLEQITALE